MKEITEKLEKKESKHLTERCTEANESHQVRSKICIFDAELGLSILVRRRVLETVTMTTRHSTTALTCRQKTTASTWPPANMRRVSADPFGPKLAHRGGNIYPHFRLMELTSELTALIL